MVAICAAIVMAIQFLPAVFIAAAAYTAGSPLLGPVIPLAVLILLLIGLVAEGFVAAQVSTYWTLAFRRLEIDWAPLYEYQQPQAPPLVPTA
ncbi:MAG: hypothetical protein ACYDA0_03865 [Candidatus Dormibacteraceae bacterium]